MPLAPGTRLGPYEILAPIGAGGMGEVYRARDTRLNREVAVKVLPEHLQQDPQALARFEREAQAVAALSHPNILVLHDVGLDDGVAYAVTELLEGETLRERLNETAFPWQKAADVGASIAEGLAAAHTKGIVHSDIKPANIFLTADGRVKILDFGLARQKAAAAPHEITATLTEPDGNITGTIGYMSPEQVRGGDVRPASDIFSLGCVLYEMITGRRAFAGSSAGDTMAAILKEEPAPIADSGRHASPELDRVIQRCLAKFPAQRFQSAHDLAFALHSISSASGHQPAAAPPQRRWRLAAAVAAMALLAVAGAIYWRTGSSGSIDSIAVLYFANAGGSPDGGYLSDGISETLIDSLSELPKLRVMSRSAVSRYKGKETDPRAVGRELGVRAVLSGRVTERGENLSVSAELVNATDDSHLWGEQYNRKITDALAVQNEIAQQITEKLRLRLTSEQKTRLSKRQTANPEAYQLYLKGRYFSAQFNTESFKKGLDYFHQAIAIDPSYALAYDGISYAYSLADDAWMAPDEAGPRSLEAGRKAVELDASLSEAHTDLGFAYLCYSYDWPAADREVRRAIEINPNYAPAHQMRAWLLTAMGSFDQSIAEGQRAVALDPLSYEILAYHRWDLYWARRYNDIVSDLTKSIDLNPHYWATFYNAGQAYQQLSRFSEAFAEFEKAREEIGDQPWLPLAQLAVTSAMSGDRVQARRTLDELQIMCRRTYVAPAQLAAVYAALGEKDQAFSHLEEAYAQHSFWMIWLKVEPQFDTLRSDPRFQSLLQRMKFP
jgi:serine/threonine protein kinase